MGRGVLSEDLEFASYVLADDVSSMAEVLKGLYPNCSGSLNCLKEKSYPPISCE